LRVHWLITISTKSLPTIWVNLLRKQPMVSLMRWSLPTPILVAIPAAGSPRYAHELNLPGLRFWPLACNPRLVFYVERPDHIDVWRVLHGTRDIPQWMTSVDVI
jgi:hypothetical protein